MRKQRSPDLASPWKEALERFLESFVAFFYRPIHDALDWSRGYESLDKELHQIVRDVGTGRRLARLQLAIEHGLRKDHTARLVGSGRAT
jgi:hypothetical protein